MFIEANIVITHILDFISFPMLQTRSIYLNFPEVIAKTVSANQILVFCLYWFPWLFNMILYFTKILDLISIPMLQTRSLYVYYEQSYSQNRLNQSKSSFLFITVSMVI